MKIRFKLNTKFFVRVVIGSLLLLSSFWVFDLLRESKFHVETKKIPIDEIRIEDFSVEHDFNDTLLVVEKIIPEERYEKEMPELPTQPVVAVYEKKDIISEIKELLTYIVGLLNGVLGMILLFQKVFRKKSD